MHSIRQFSAFYSHFQVLVKSRHFWVTSGNLRSRDAIVCHVTASCRGQEPCRNSNAQYTQVFGFLQPLPGDFRLNDVTFASLPVTWGDVTSFSVPWLPPPASYSLVESQTHSIRQFSAFYSHFQVTSGQMTLLPNHFLSPQVTWRHFLSRHGLLLQATACRNSNTQYTPVFGLLQPLPDRFWSNENFRVTSGHLRSRDVISGHVTASSCKPQPCRKLNHSTRKFSAFYSLFQVTSGQMTSLLGHHRSP